MTITLVVDTSALVAIVRDEAGAAAMLAAVLAEKAGLPAPALVEFLRVMALTGNRPDPRAFALVAALELRVLAFDNADAEAAAIANEAYGSGNGRGGPLNLLDLMVYAAARVAQLPILCTGKDFAATDAVLHPASRRY